MKRRQFLATSATMAGLGLASGARLFGEQNQDDRKPTATGRIYTSPAEAMAAPREELAYVLGVYVGTKVREPDFLAAIDLDPASPTYSQVVHRLPMPNGGDELHHFGWNACG